MATNEITPAEMLKEVNNAIYNICVGGQAYTIGSRSLTRADLSKLYEMQRDLQAQVAEDTNSNLMGDTYVAVFGGR